MITVVLLVIFVLLFFAHYLVTRSFASPVSLLLVSFIMALTLIVINDENWQVFIKDRFIVYIFIAVGAFSAGCFLATTMMPSVHMGKGDKCRVPDNQTAISNYSILFIVISSLLCTAVYVLIAVRIGLSNGGGGSLFRAIYVASSANTHNFVFHQFREIVVALAEVSVIVFFKSLYLFRKPIKLLIIPIICFFACTMFATDRNIFIRFIVFVLCIWILFYSSMSGLSIVQTNKRIIRITSIVVLLAVVAFYLLGKLKSYTSNFERMVGIYGGSGLYNFNYCLDILERMTPQYGTQTFSQLIETLRIFGIDIGGSLSSNYQLGMVVFSAPNGYVYASNIYSAMAPYVMDFGIFGLILFPLVFGGVFELLYCLATDRGSYYLWGLYSMLAYAIVYFTIGDQFFMRFHLGLVYELMWYTLLYLVVVGTNRVKLNSGLLV